MPAGTGSRSAFAGGLSEQKKLGLERVTLPEKAKCKICKKVQPLSRYSKKQLSDLRHNIYSYGEPALSAQGVVKCSSCIGGQVTELTCCICDETKGLDAFAKTQRRVPDEARCLDCVQKVLNTVPLGDTEEVEEDNDEEGIYQGSSNYQASKTRTFSEFSSSEIKDVSVSASEDTAKEASFIPSDRFAPHSASEGVWVDLPRRGASTIRGDASVSTQMDATSRKDSELIAPSVDGSLPRTWSMSGSQHQREVRPAGDPSSKFAKVPGRRVPLGQVIGVAPGYLGPPKDITAPPTRSATALDDDDDDEELDATEYL